MSGTEQTGRGNEEPGLTQLLQALLSDCQEEICLERVRHEPRIGPAPGKEESTDGPHQNPFRRSNPSYPKTAIA